MHSFHSSVVLRSGDRKNPSPTASQTDGSRRGLLPLLSSASWPCSARIQTTRLPFVTGICGSPDGAISGFGQRPAEAGESVTSQTAIFRVNSDPIPDLARTFAMRHGIEKV